MLAEYIAFLRVLLRYSSLIADIYIYCQEFNGRIFSVFLFSPSFSCIRVSSSLLDLLMYIYHCQKSEKEGKTGLSLSPLLGVRKQGNILDAEQF